MDIPLTDIEITPMRALLRLHEAEAMGLCSSLEVDELVPLLFHPLYALRMAGGKRKR